MGQRSARCGRQGEGRAGHARDDRRARPRAGRGGRRASRPAACATPTCTTARAASTTTSPSCSATRPPASSSRSGPDVTRPGAGRLRRPQLAGRVRRVPVLPARPALVLLRHPQRHPEDDAGRRHAALPRPRHRRLRRQDAGGGRASAPRSTRRPGPRRSGCSAAASWPGSARPCSPARSGLGDSVAVFGCGGVGCAAVAGSKLAGAATIIAVDLDPRKLELATRVRRHPHRRRRRRPTRSRRSRALTGGNGADVCIEAVGQPAGDGAGLLGPRPGRARWCRSACRRPTCASTCR